ncbi:MAG: alpha/beta hydrolase [Treponema sp.]|nr:alpha/beta hydrolase [Treponema sp.]
MILLWIFAALFTVFAVCSILVYLNLFRPNILRAAKTADDVPEKDGQLAQYLPELRRCVAWYKEQQKETVQITSYDGLRLSAEYLPAVTPRGTIICMHGFHSSAVRDFSPVVRFLHENGWNLLLPSQRSHGKSEGRYLTFGVRERYDCRSWVTFINGRNGTGLPVVLYGVSMGCATVVMSLGLEQPVNVKAVVADCGFTSPYEEIANVLKNYNHLPVHPVMLFARMQTRVIAGFGLKEYSTFDALRNNKIPVLFIHGGRDKFVPTEMSRRNYEACTAPKDLLIVEHAEHAVSSILDTAEYEKKTAGFLEKYAVR